MSAATRQRVEDAITALSYRVNIAARGLRRSRHYCVALFVVDTRSNFLAQPAHHQIAAGLSNVLSSSGYALAIEGVQPSEVADLSCIERLSTDAICLLASGRESDRRAVLERLRATGQPVVVFHEVASEDDGGLCFVRSDDREAGHILAEHLHSRGCRRILLLLPQIAWTTMNERAAGIRAFCRGRKEMSVSTIRAEAISVEAVHRALHAYLPQGKMPDAVVGGNDLLAAAAQKFFLSSKVKTMRQVKVAGFGGYEFLQFLDKRITSVRIPSYEMGEAAAREILQALGNGGVFRDAELCLAVTLIEGEST